MSPGGPYRPCAFAPHVSGTPSGDQEDVTVHSAFVMWWGAEGLFMTLVVNAR